MFYPNQKQITIIRENVEKTKNTGRLYLIAYQDNLIEAMNLLSPAAFKVYVCLLFNKDGYKVEFSPEHLKRMTGLCKDTVRKAVGQLINCGYIEELKENKLVFHEERIIPKNYESSDSLFDKTKIFKDDNTGLDITVSFRQLVKKIGYEAALEKWEEGCDE